MLVLARLVRVGEAVDDVDVVGVVNGVFATDSLPGFGDDLESVPAMVAEGRAACEARRPVAWVHIAHGHKVAWSDEGQESPEWRNTHGHGDGTEHLG